MQEARCLGQRISATKATTHDVSFVDCAMDGLAFDLPPVPEGLRKPSFFIRFSKSLLLYVRVESS